MSRIEEIEQQIAALTEAELAAFRERFAEYEAERWDRQIEEDAASGRLEALAERARSEHQAGRSRLL